MGNLSVASLGWFCYELEAVKKSVPPRTHFIFLSANGMEATPDVLRKSVMASNRQSERVVRTVKFSIAGSITHSLFPSQAASMLMAVMGLDSYMTALTADTLSAAGVVANGQATLTLTNSGSLTYTKGAWVILGDHLVPQTEVALQILDITINNGAPGTVIKVKDPTGDEGGIIASGTKIQQGQQHFFHQIPASSPAVMTLPTISIEFNEGGKYAWLMAGCYVHKYNIKGTKEDVEISETLAASTLPKRLDRPGGGVARPWTVFNPTEEELADAQRPFTIVDGYCLLPQDPNTTGTSTQGLLATLEDWELDIDAGLLTHDFWNKSRVKDHSPGNVKQLFKYRYANEADRPTEFEDYLVAPYNKPVAGFISLSTNVGTPTVPEWNCWGAYIPNMLITKAPTSRTSGGVLTVDVEADILLGPSGEEPLLIFVMNGDHAAYAGVAGTPFNQI